MSSDLYFKMYQIPLEHIKEINLSILVSFYSSDLFKWSGRWFFCQTTEILKIFLFNIYSIFKNMNEA